MPATRVAAQKTSAPLKTAMAQAASIMTSAETDAERESARGRVSSSDFRYPPVAETALRPIMVLVWLWAQTGENEEAIAPRLAFSDKSFCKHGPGSAPLDRGLGQARPPRQSRNLLGGPQLPGTGEDGPAIPKSSKRSRFWPWPMAYDPTCEDCA